mgnify:CR=1 FL=1
MPSHRQSTTTSTARLGKLNFLNVPIERNRHTSWQLPDSIFAHDHTSQSQLVPTTESTRPTERRPTNVLSKAPAKIRKPVSNDVAKETLTRTDECPNSVFANARYSQTTNYHGDFEMRRRFGPRNAFLSLRHLRRDRNRDNTHLKEFNSWLIVKNCRVTGTKSKAA